jgi:hypothetical protein
MVVGDQHLVMMEQLALTVSVAVAEEEDTLAEFVLVEEEETELLLLDI